MELNFPLHAKRLYTLGISLTAEEIAKITAALPVLIAKHGLPDLHYFGRIWTLKQPYNILFSETQDGTVFLATSDLIKYEILPKADERVILALNELNYGICSREPFFGRLNKKLPKEAVEEKEEQEEEPIEEKHAEPEEDYGEPEAAPQEKPLPPIIATEAHRLAHVLEEINQSMQIVFLDAFIKQGGKMQQNTQFRGLIKPSLKNLALYEEFNQYLLGNVEKENIRTLLDEPAKHYYSGEFDIARNCLIVKNIYFQGLVFYVFSGALVWGKVYDGNGLAYDIV